ncbi:hypothetical protein N9954_08625, partial [Maribacter sp.]|nr:hypothetical protein [Maribacter sp.]
NSALFGLALPLFGAKVIQPISKLKSPQKKNQEELRILILGGTSFLGPHQIAYALSRGHSITTFTRGKSRPTIHQDLFEKVTQLIGDRENDLKALETGDWDVVIDNSGHKTEWTKKSASLLKDRAGLYIYTSSTGVYYPYLEDLITEDTEVLTIMPQNLKDEELKMEYGYGVMKSTSEIETIKAFGADRSLIVRPTYMIGPADKSDRFIYWPLRLSKGGDIMIPGKAADPVQYIDVRDVAEWTIRSAEEKLSGVFNAVGPRNRQTMTEFINAAKNAFDVPSTLVPIADYKFLKDNGVHHIVPWIMPEGYNYGSARVDNQKAIQNGLTFRAIETSTKDTYNWWISDALSNERRSKFEQKEGSIMLREKGILENWSTYNR